MPSTGLSLINGVRELGRVLITSELMHARADVGYDEENAHKRKRGKGEHSITSLMSTRKCFFFFWFF